MEARGEESFKVRVRVRNPVLSDAVRFALFQAGCVEVDDDEALTISDSSDDGADIVLVPDSRVACRQAMERLVSGSPASILPARLIHEVVQVVVAGRGDYALIHREAIRMAGDVPELSPRAIAVLRNVVSGHSDRAIARFLMVSEATVKREVAGLRAALGVVSRNELIVRGFGAGFVAFDESGEAR